MRMNTFLFDGKDDGVKIFYSKVVELYYCLASNYRWRSKAAALVLLDVLLETRRPNAFIIESLVAKL